MDRTGGVRLPERPRDGVPRHDQALHARVLVQETVVDGNGDGFVYALAAGLLEGLPALRGGAENPRQFAAPEGRMPVGMMPPIREANDPRPQRQVVVGRPVLPRTLVVASVGVDSAHYATSARG